MRILSILSSALVGFAILSSPAVAQQKTAKACQEEWRANKAANQAAGVKEKDYVAKCRTGAAASPAPTAAPTAAPPPAAQTAPAPAPAARPMAPAARPMAPAASNAPTGANQFSTEAQAQGRCPARLVVWANLPSKIYHFAGGRDYGHTKRGAYMCEQDAQAAGMRAAKNEKHP